MVHRFTSFRVRVSDEEKVERRKGMAWYIGLLWNKSSGMVGRDY